MPLELEAYTCRKVYRGFRATYTPMQAISLLFQSILMCTLMSIYIATIFQEDKS